MSSVVDLTSSARRRTESRSARSSSRIWIRAVGTARRISTSASCAFPAVRAVPITVAPARASSRAVISPRPLFAPVTTALRPL
jgi:hypothetical protein